jgi:GR25 family glycosyltransferase involved in LPS biosynthesis
MKIDKIYVINLEHRTDRRTQMEEQLKRVNIENYEFFKAIQPTLDEVHEWNPKYLSPTPPWLSTSTTDIDKYRIGSLGCLKSHLSIVTDALSKGYENIMILEDDTEFLFDMKFKDVLRHLKPHTDLVEENEYGILYLSGNHNGGIVKKMSGNISFVQGTLTTGSYIISKRGMELMIKQINSYEREVDVYYGFILQTQLKCFCFTPHITRQGAGFSDILQKTVSYPLNQTIKPN